MLAVLGVTAHSLAAQARPSLVDVGGHRLNVQVAGTSHPGVPTVVFESDAAGSVTGLVLVQNGARQHAPKAR